MGARHGWRRLRRQLGGLLSALWHLDGLIVGGLVVVVGVIGGKREVPIVVRVALLLIPSLLLAVVGYFLVFGVG